MREVGKRRVWFAYAQADDDPSVFDMNASHCYPVTKLDRGNWLGLAVTIQDRYKIDEHTASPTGRDQNDGRIGRFILVKKP
jgi:hypothetical protein